MSYDQGSSERSCGFDGSGRVVSCESGRGTPPFSRLSEKKRSHDRPINRPTGQRPRSPHEHMNRVSAVRWSRATTQRKSLARIFKDRQQCLFRTPQHAGGRGRPKKRRSCGGSFWRKATGKGEKSTWCLEREHRRPPYVNDTVDERLGGLHDGAREGPQKSRSCGCKGYGKRGQKERCFSE